MIVKLGIDDSRQKEIGGSLNLDNAHHSILQHYPPCADYDSGTTILYLV